MSNVANLIPLSAVPELVPGTPCIATVRRWCSRGVRGRRLSSVMRGGRIFVDKNAVSDFLKSEPMPIGKSQRRPGRKNRA